LREIGFLLNIFWSIPCSYSHCGEYWLEVGYWKLWICCNLLNMKLKKVIHCFRTRFTSTRDAGVYEIPKLW